MRCAWLALLPLAACLEAPPTSPPTCGTSRSLADDFTDPSSGRLTTYGPVSEVADGRLLLQAGPDEYAGAFSNHWYRFDGGELTIALRSVDLEGDAELRVQVMTDDDDLVAMSLASGFLTLQRGIAGEYSEHGSVAFDPEMTWWRLRETDGVFQLATSSDGDSWTEHGQVAADFPGPGGALVEVGGWSAQARAEIEAINRPGGEGACPSGTFTDSFDGASLRWWTTDLPGCDVSIDGELAISYDDSVGECGLESSELFDLRGSQVAVEAVGIGDCDPVVGFGLQIGTIHPVFTCVDMEGVPTLVAEVWSEDGSPLDLVATLRYERDQHRWWRIRHEPDAKRLVFETADAGGVWTGIGDAPAPDGELAEVKISLSARDDSPDGVIDPIVFDNLNQAPP